MEQELIRLGYSLTESKIYIELLKNKFLLAGEISKKTMVNRRTVYDTLSRLEEKGLVGHNLSANKKQYYAIEPEAILRNIDTMKESAIQILPELKHLAVIGHQDTKVVLYTGRKGVRNILSLVLECKEYVSFGSNEEFPKLMTHDYQYFQNMKNKLKIKTRTILSHDLKGKSILKSVSTTTQFKFLSSKIGPSSTFIFNNKVAIFIWEEPCFGILIESKNVYDSYKEYFEELWKIAKK